MSRNDWRLLLAGAFYWAACVALALGLAWIFEAVS